MKSAWVHGVVMWGCLVGMTLVAWAEVGPDANHTRETAAERASEPAVVLKVRPIPEALRTAYQIHPFYKKCVVIRDIPIIGSNEVSDYAFLECANTVEHLLNGRDDVLKALRNRKVRVGIIAVTQYTMDIPENQHPAMMAKGAFNDRRSRGLGGIPLTTCAEENLLNLNGDPYVRENITIHEFAHTIAFAYGDAHKEWWQQVQQAYKDAKASGGYGQSYAISNPQEYFAEGAQAWFDAADPRNSGGAANRQQLKEKDPALAKALEEIYGDGSWRYLKTTSAERPESDKTHLKGLDRNKMPTFKFENSPRIKAAATQSTTKPTAKPTTKPTTRK